jgi:proteic killer suppression protein
VIKSFKDKETEKLFKESLAKRIPYDIQKRAKFKLISIDDAKTVADLKAPPSNNLESLKGDRKGQYSIRINEQWRICFKFENGDAFDVEIVDYH